MNYQKSLFLVVLCAFIYKSECGGVEDNEISAEYEEPINTKAGMQIYYDYRGVCSNDASVCVDSNACNELNYRSDVCPQKSSNVVCCKTSSRTVQIFEKERLCALLGGSCVRKQDCYPDELPSIKGMCPKNRYLGVECCYRVKMPKKLQRCEEDFNGACMSRCHPSLQRPANDCGKSESCCVLVN